MPMTDFFNSTSFSMISLTEAINKLPFRPSRIGEMKLFRAQGINTTTVVIEEKNGLLTLLPTVPRGAPATLGHQGKRTVRSFAVPHIPFEDTILAESIQDVRAFGSEDKLQGQAQVVNDRLQEMRQAHEVTHEHLRIGAIKGTIVDSDGSTVIFNLFTEFSVSQTTVDFLLGTAGTKIQQKCTTVLRAIDVALGAGGYEHVHCFCGATWFDAFVSHTLVKAAYGRYQDGAFLRDDLRKGFQFGGITFEEYRGTVNGVAFIPTNQANFFPVGVPGLFNTALAPADFMETVNTVGIAIYAKQERMPFDRGVNLHTQSNPLPICTRPGVLIKGTNSG